MPAGHLSSASSPPMGDEILLRVEVINDTWDSPNHAILVIGRRGSLGFARVFPAPESGGEGGRMDRIRSRMTAGIQAVEAAASWAEATIATYGPPAGASVYLAPEAGITLPPDARPHLNAACGVGYGRSVPRQLGGDFAGSHLSMTGQADVLAALVAMNATGVPADLDSILANANGVVTEVVGLTAEDENASAGAVDAPATDATVQDGAPSAPVEHRPEDAAMAPRTGATPTVLAADPGPDPLFVRIQAINDASQPKRLGWCVAMRRGSHRTVSVITHGNGIDVIPKSARWEKMADAIKGIEAVLVESIAQHGAPSALGVAGDPMGGIAEQALPDLVSMLARLGVYDLPLAGYSATVAALPTVGVAQARAILRAPNAGAPEDFAAFVLACRAAFGFTVDDPGAEPGRANADPVGGLPEHPVEPTSEPVLTDTPCATGDETNQSGAVASIEQPQAEAIADDTRPADGADNASADPIDAPVDAAASPMPDLADPIRVRISPVNACAFRGPFGALIIAMRQDRVAVRAVVSTVDQGAIHGSNLCAKRREARLLVRCLAEQATAEAVLEVSDGASGEVALGAVASPWVRSVIGMEDRIAENSRLARLRDDPQDMVPPASGDDILRKAMRRGQEAVDTDQLRVLVRDAVLATLRTTRKVAVPPLDGVLPDIWETPVGGPIGPRPYHVPTALSLGDSGTGTPSLDAAQPTTESGRPPATSPSSTTATAANSVRRERQEAPQDLAPAEGRNEGGDEFLGWNEAAPSAPRRLRTEACEGGDTRHDAAASIEAPSEGRSATGPHAPIALEQDPFEMALPQPMPLVGYEEDGGHDGDAGSQDYVPRSGEGYRPSASVRRIARAIGEVMDGGYPPNITEFMRLRVVEMTLPSPLSELSDEELGTLELIGIRLRELAYKALCEWTLSDLAGTSASASDAYPSMSELIERAVLRSGPGSCSSDIVARHRLSQALSLPAGVERNRRITEVYPQYPAFPQSH